MDENWGYPHGFGYPQMVIRLRTVAVASLRPAAELRALHHGALRAVTVAWCVRQTPWENAMKSRAKTMKNGDLMVVNGQEWWLMVIYGE